jgi:hypothetical protein
MAGDEQQSWLNPPLESTQTGVPVTGSGAVVLHAVPVQVALHCPPDPHPSDWSRGSSSG